MPSVSVTIATYNRSAMVRQAIAAALAQTRAPEEIVVTDDASTDDTWAALEALAAEQPNVRIFRRDQNSGGVENWNAAIEQSSGDFIAWCSDDDRFLPDHLEASIEFLRLHPSVGLVHSGFVDALETNETVVEIPRPLRFVNARILERDGLLPYIVRYYDWPFHPSTIVMRRSVWNSVGPFDRRWALADTDWFVRVAEQFPIAMLPRHGVLNRRHVNNWSNRVGSARMQREILEIVEGSIERIYASRPVSRVLWRTLWRANVRLRLLLTLRARLRSAHSDAARSAWEALTLHTGWSVPKVLVGAGSALIRRWCARHHTTLDNVRSSVSPL